MKGFVFFLKLLLVIAMLAFIWGQSLMPGDVSSMESEWFLTWVQPAVVFVQRLLARFGFVYELSYLVRKMAHFSEYAVLGVLMYWLFVKPDGRSRYVLPAGLCLASACVDEGIQIFAVERGPALKDVMIDFAGACAGILVMSFFVMLLYNAAQRRKRRRAARRRRRRT